MGKGRLEAFSDGVVAIIITIMVLELRAPDEASWAALRPLLPVFLSYVLSFVFVGIYWNNHHHLLHATQRITGGVLWANLHLLFWLSLVPFATAWIGEHHDDPVPAALYGIVLLMAGIAYTILFRTICRVDGNEGLVRAVGTDLKGRLSLLIYGLAVIMAFVDPWISDGCYITVALMWLVPDRRIERRLTENER
jgi:uncharacterized membrane protein